MFCMKCGNAIPDDSKFCSACGNRLYEDKNEGQQAVVYASQNENSDTVVSTNKTKKISKIVILIITGVILIAIAILVFNEVGKADLRKQLDKLWYNSGESIIRVLEFSDDEIECRLETGYKWMDTTLCNFDYKVIGKNKIKIKRYTDNYDTYTITFSKDKKILTVTPAITSLESDEVWYDID